MGSGSGCARCSPGIRRYQCCVLVQSKAQNQWLFHHPLSWKPPTVIQGVIFRHRPSANIMLDRTEICMIKFSSGLCLRHSGANCLAHVLGPQTLARVFVACRSQTSYRNSSSRRDRVRVDGFNSTPISTPPTRKRAGVTNRRTTDMCLKRAVATSSEESGSDRQICRVLQNCWNLGSSHESA